MPLQFLDPLSWMFWNSVLDKIPLIRYGFISYRLYTCLNKKSIIILISWNRSKKPIIGIKSFWDIFWNLSIGKMPSASLNFVKNIIAAHSNLYFRRSSLLCKQTSTCFQNDRFQIALKASRRGDKNYPEQKKHITDFDHTYK